MIICTDVKSKESKFACKKCDIYNKCCSICDEVCEEQCAYKDYIDCTEKLEVDDGKHK